MVSQCDHVCVVAAIFQGRLKHRHKLASHTLTHFVRTDYLDLGKHDLLASLTVQRKTLARPECLGLISRLARIGCRMAEVWLRLSGWCG